jgi:Uncharacterised protein family, YAP/Alf4/glomulin
MATSAQGIETDPLTAALPPNSDYITYLTILEYQLTPERLSILTHHLASDDGTLAKEIGWDLVKLILPLLDAAPKDAAKCLEVVSRRGNPREVVVRVAEALESLGADDGDVESGLDQDSGTNEPPTFAGESQAIHLGKMELRGMPPPPTRKETPRDEQVMEEQEDALTASDSSELQFSTLLSMLGLLHSRIKTQYPSRFLATSLPAALGAYRKIPITSETTISFIALLEKMSGKQRPKLPPRSSTASATRLQTVQNIGTEVYAPLPDPEVKSGEKVEPPSDHEMLIVQRLLQAVMLEVLEEYLLADPSSLEWSTRVLEKQSPDRLIPSRTSRSKAWQDEETLQVKDEMMVKFLRLAKDLNLTPEDVFRSTNLPLSRDESPEDVVTDPNQQSDEDEEPSEFPTSPSQIPYSHLGALFLYLAVNVPALVYSDQDIPPLDMSALDLHHFVNQFVVPTPTLITDHLIPSVTHNPHSAIDALLALLLLTPLPNLPRVTTSETSTDADYRSLITILSYLSAEHPNPSFRASAHHLATNLLHTHPSPTFRLTTIKSIIKDCEPFPTLKEVAINWLKEEILLTVKNPPPTSAASNNETNIFALPTLFSDDETLISLIFPTPPIPSPSTAISTDQPPAASTPQPQYAPTIAALNLLFLLLTNPTLKSRYNLTSKLSSLQPTPSTFDSRIQTFLTALRNHLAAKAGKGSKEEEGKLGLLALAVGRVVGALEGYAKENRGEERRI